VGILSQYDRIRGWEKEEYQSCLVLSVAVDPEMNTKDPIRTARE
jgi:hypothetical protein